MRTSIIGYPRVGSLRELKFATEKYFRKEISSDKLQNTAKEIRKANWLTLKASGLDFIPSNDFSFYDNLLDTAVLFNIIPERYVNLDVSPMWRYFAMARGYQGEAGDVKALAMKKWFNTNYHYMVPEIEDDTQIKLAGSKPFDEYEEAKAAGVKTKPVIAGPFTLLKLLRYTGSKTAEEYAGDVITAYSESLIKLNHIGAEWVQFDEPYLVYDLTESDIALFEKLYSGILSTKNKVKVLLQTYFGDIRDCYKNVSELDFDGIGLDFVEGKKTFVLISENGFADGKILFAGAVNGKNIWKDNYERALDLTARLKAKGIETVLSTSCSLLHVPYTLKNETKPPQKYLAHFAFAEEKLLELAELKLLSETDYTNENLYKANIALHQNRPDCNDPAVKKSVAAIKESDFTRLPAFDEREKIQKGIFSPAVPNNNDWLFSTDSGCEGKPHCFQKRQHHRTGIYRIQP